jgi:hypothetical protein
MGNILLWKAQSFTYEVTVLLMQGVGTTSYAAWADLNILALTPVRDFFCKYIQIDF